MKHDGEVKMNGDKKALTELRDELRDPEGEFRVPSTFLMEDIKVDSWRKNIDMHLNSYALSSKYAAELSSK